MDNHSIHHSDDLVEMCERKGVYLVYLPPYLPDFNPIEQSFAQLKAWMRKNQRLADLFGHDFEGFIRLALRKVFQGKDARGHYRACGYGVGESFKYLDSDSDSESE
jgi:transposase